MGSSRSFLVAGTFGSEYWWFMKLYHLKGFFFLSVGSMPDVEVINVAEVLVAFVASQCCTVTVKVVFWRQAKVEDKLLVVFFFLLLFLVFIIVPTKNVVREEVNTLFLPVFPANTTSAAAYKQQKPQQPVRSKTETHSCGNNCGVVHVRRFSWVLKKSFWKMVVIVLFHILRQSSSSLQVPNDNAMSQKVEVLKQSHKLITKSLRTSSGTRSLTFLQQQLLVCCSLLLKDEGIWIGLAVLQEVAAHSKK